jgi:hypothetical protein
MHKLNIAVAVGAAVLLTGTASAGKKPEDPDKVVCKTDADSTSRITRKRTCRTRAEWTMEEVERRRDAEQGLDKSYQQTLQPVRERPN